MKANESIKRLAAKKGVKIKLHNVIYKLIEDLKEELNNRLPPAVAENTIGQLSFTVNFLLCDATRSLFCNKAFLFYQIFDSLL